VLLLLLLRIMRRVVWGTWICSWHGTSSNQKKKKAWN